MNWYKTFWKKFGHSPDTIILEIYDKEVMLNIKEKQKPLWIKLFTMVLVLIEKKTGHQLSFKIEHKTLGILWYLIM